MLEDEVNKTVIKDGLGKTLQALTEFRVKSATDHINAADPKTDIEHIAVRAAVSFFLQKDFVATLFLFKGSMEVHRDQDEYCQQMCGQVNKNLKGLDMKLKITIERT